MKLITTILAIAFLSFASAQENDIWFHNLEDAQTEAVSQYRYILLNFSGSDWCGNCIRLEKDLFSNEAFIEYAKDNLVLVNLDFPMKKANKLSEEQTAYNESLADKYNKTGVFPTTLILDMEGNLVTKLPQTCANVTDYINQIKKTLSIDK